MYINFGKDEETLIFLMNLKRDFTKRPSLTLYLTDLKSSQTELHDLHNNYVQMGKKTTERAKIIKIIR